VLQLPGGFLLLECRVRVTSRLTAVTLKGLDEAGLDLEAGVWEKYIGKL
jgi:hypothetical protein